MGLGSPAVSAPLRDSPVAVLSPPPAIGGVRHTSVAYNPFLADGGEVREYRQEVYVSAHLPWPHPSLPAPVAALPPPPLPPLWGAEEGDRVQRGGALINPLRFLRPGSHPSLTATVVCLPPSPLTPAMGGEGG